MNAQQKPGGQENPISGSWREHWQRLLRDFIGKVDEEQFQGWDKAEHRLPVGKKEEQL